MGNTLWIVDVLISNNKVGVIEVYAADPVAAEDQAADLIKLEAKKGYEKNDQEIETPTAESASQPAAEPLPEASV